MNTLVLCSILWVAFALSAGLLISKLMKIINFPNVTGYLIAGIIIGPWVIGLFFGKGNTNYFNSILNEISWVTDIALGFIAFTIGGSFKLSALKKVGKRATIISIFEAVGGSLIVILGLSIAMLCGMDINISTVLIFGSIACATAPAATLLVIAQYKARGPVTDTLIPVVAFDDAIALIVFAILFSLAEVFQTGADFNVLEAIVFPLLEIVLSIVVGAILGFVIGQATKWFKSRHNRLILCICGVLMCVGLSQIDTSVAFNWPFSFQLSSLLTVMALGGVYVNTAKGQMVTNEYLDKFTSPVFMLFFIISGARLNFGIFGSDKALVVIAVAAIYLITRVIGKILGAGLGSKVTKCEKNVQKYLGFALVPQAGVALGLAANAQTYYTKLGNSTPYLDTLGNPTAMGQELISFGSLIYTVIIVSTMVYELTGPLITKWALTKAGEITKETAPAA